MKYSLQKFTYPFFYSVVSIHIMQSNVAAGEWDGGGAGMRSGGEGLGGERGCLPRLQKDLD